MIIRISYDHYNDNAVVKTDVCEVLFANARAFCDAVGFNFDDARIISYEPERNFFCVERVGGSIVGGNDVAEIVWITENATTIERIANEEYQSQQLALQPSLADTRRAELSATDWLVIRHRDQVDIGTTTTLSAQQYTELLTYRQALRDAGDAALLPPAPAFLTDN